MARRRDRAERLLALATAWLPPRRAEWGAAMRAELAAIDAAETRRRFARGAAAAALARGLGIRLAVALGAGAVVAVGVLIVSRVQLQDGGPGVLGVSVFGPAGLLLAVALATARVERSFRVGLSTGLLALATSFGAVFAVVASEGLVWMGRHGVFVLDGDPPRQPVGDLDVVLDFFSTGMWLGHLLFWLPWPVLGAALGT